MRRDPSLIPLSHQHHNGLALCVLTDRELSGDASPENLRRLSRRIVDRYEIELANHFAIEEEVLFPSLAESPLTARLVSEHRQLEGLVDQLRRLPDPQAIRDFTALLRTHIRSEEREFFEEAQNTLPRETLDRLGAEIDRRAVRVCL